MHTIKCRKCDGQFNLKALSKTKGRCPSCGALVPVSDYCAYIHERRWWHLFSAAPISLKFVVVLCSIVCAFFLPCQVLLVVCKLLEGRCCHVGLHMMFGAGFHLALGCVGFFIAPVLAPMIWGAVRGRIPYVSFAILAVFLGCWYLVESAGPDTALWIFYLSCLAVLLLIPYFTPAAIRWRTRCREERLAFLVAVNSGADLTTLEVREYPLKKVSIGVCLVLVLAVLGLSGLAEVKVFCALKARGSSCHVLDHGTDEGILKEGNYDGGLVIKRGSSSGEFIIKTSMESGLEEGELDVEEYVVRQRSGGGELEIIEAYEYSYKPKEGGADVARAEGKMEPRWRKSRTVALKDDLLIVNAYAYSLNGDSGYEGRERSVRPLPEGHFSPADSRFSRVWVEIKKGRSKGEFVIEASGSNGAMEPWNATEYVVRQHPDREKLEVVKAYHYTYTPKEGVEEPVRTGGAIDAKHYNDISLVIKGDFLVVNGFAYLLKEE